MSESSIDIKIIRLGERHDLEGLEKLVESTSIKMLQATLTAKLGRNDCASFWNYLLLGFDAKKYESREKRFACVKCFLDNLLKVELSFKQTYDLVTRLCQDLDTFPSEQLVEIYEHCIDGIRLGDPKCVGWKDLLPETVKTMSTMPEVHVNGVSMSGLAYRINILNNLCTMRWPIEVLTPIANMFKDLNLSNDEIEIALKKFCNALDSLSPLELPALCFQIFSMCTTALQIVILLLALEKYFHRYYYKKLFADMNSNSTDFDSIDKFSDKELREAEETILHHLNYCTQFKITELQMCAVLRNFQAIPDVILTPFMLSAIISMTAANREPESRLSTSILLPFLRGVIKNNEDERLLTDESVWCRDTLQRKEVDLVQLFTVLIDQNKEGKDIITPGLVNLAFVLLKTKNNKTLNFLAIAFLIKFVRKRFLFGQGVVKKLVEWMIVEQDQYQYSECLTQLSVADTFTVSECLKTIQYFLDFLLWIPGEQAMRMMAFVLPILKISPIIRDAFIEILRKAMNSSDDKTRHMAIYGFCMILKQLNNSNSQRSQSGMSSTLAFCTQHSISGFSLISQTILGNRSSSQRNFDMLTLEIIGVLRNCFNQSIEIKTTLYENLHRAVELNSKLTPHVLQFIDWHFRSYFEVSASEEDIVDANEADFSVKFDRIVQAKDLEQNEIIINDNIGQLILFVAHCLNIFEKYETDYDTQEIKRLLKLSVEKVISKDLKWEEMTGTLTHYKHAVISQQVNFIEGLMAHLVLSSKQTNDNVKFLGPLFREHQKLRESMKKLTAKKSQKKSKNESENLATNVTINGAVVTKIEVEIQNIWDLCVMEKLLRLLHENIVPFASAYNTTSLRSNVELVRYVFEETTKKIEVISLAPEYKQLSHSKRVLKYLTDITKVVYERSIKRLPEVWRDFDMKSAELAAECFRQCLQTADKVYKKNFLSIFVKGFDVQAMQRPHELPSALHLTIDEYMKEMLQEQTDAMAEKIPAALLLSLEVLYDNIVYVDSMTTESYAWLLKFCKEYAIQSRQLCIAHKLLFTQRQKTHSGAFFNIIAKTLAKVLGRIDDHDSDETDEENATSLRSINLNTAAFCLQHFFAAIRKQIQDVEYFIVKANCTLYRHKVIPDSDRDMSLGSLRSLQRSICTQMVHISNALYELTNVCTPLGPSMDGVLKLLMQLYVCLKNLAKHFLSCVSHVSLQGSKFEQLLRVVGKPLPVRVYAMITYIESNILDDEEESSKTSKKKINPKADKDKILRETRQIPKLILCMENFNKHVIILSKKDRMRLADFLHYGIARDFRVRSEQLKAAISRTLSHSSQIETDPSEQGDTEIEEETLLERMEAESALLESNGMENEDNDSSDDDENNENVSNENDNSETGDDVIAPTTRKSRNKLQCLADIEAEDEMCSKTPTPDDELRDANSNVDEPNSRSQLIRNLRKVNTKAKKRALEIEKNTEPDVAALPIPPPQTKRRRGRSGNK